MRGLAALGESRLDRGQLRDGIASDFRRTASRIGVIGQLRHRHLDEIGIAEILGAIGKDAFLDLGNQMHIARRVVRNPGKICSERIFHAQQLHECDAARTRRRRRHDGVVAPANAQWLAPYGSVGRKVAVGDQAAAALHLGNDEIGRATRVEASRAVSGDPLQHAGECRLPELDFAVRGFRRQRTEPGSKVGLACVFGQGLRHPLDQLWVRDKAIAGETDRWLQQLAPRSAAKSLMNLPETRHRSRYACRAVANKRRIGNGFALRIEIHVTGGCLRRHFAEVQEGRLVSHLQRDKPATAEIARFGVGDRQGECGSDGCIDGVTASAHDGFGDIRAVSVRCGNRSSSGAAASDSVRYRRRATRRPRNRGRCGHDCQQQQQDQVSGSRRTGRERVERVHERMFSQPIALGHDARREDVIDRAGGFRCSRHCRVG